MQPSVSLSPLKSDGALDQLRDMTMATKSRILSSLVLTAATLVIVPLSPEEASAKGLGGSGGARSSGVVRTSPAPVHKLSTPSAGQRKLSATPVGTKEKNNQSTLRKLREVETGKGKIEKEHPEKKKKHPHLHLIYPVGIGAVPAVDPPGCVYERRLEKLPGGGLQRVIVKVCPGA
jgi:hypothetical protein